MRRILYIGGFELPDKNAAAQRVIANGKLLRKMGFCVNFIGVTRETKKQNFQFEDFSCVSIPYPINTKEWIHHAMTFVTSNTIASYDPEYVILYNFPAIASLKIIRYCHRNGIKIIHDTTEWEQSRGFNLRNIYKRIDTWARMRYCIKKMDGVIAISRYLYDYYKSNVSTILVPPLVDIIDLKWNRNRKLISEARIKIVYAGSAGSKIKDRLDYIINAIAQFNSMDLVVVGITKEQYILDFGELPNNSRNIVFMGRVSHQEAVRIICDSDFQMLIRDNTLKNKAGFPTKFVESISCCTPVIATPVSNICDYLIEGKNGYIVRNNLHLVNVLEKVAKLSIEARIDMKKYCLDNNKFDYHYFENEFLKLFT